jgi:hypothetical protein
MSQGATPFSVPEVPVLCATGVPAGSAPFRRAGPGVESVMSCSSSVRDFCERAGPLWQGA